MASTDSKISARAKVPRDDSSEVRQPSDIRLPKVDRVSANLARSITDSSRLLNGRGREYSVMSLDAVRMWFQGLGQSYGVDPLIFGVIYVGAIPFFWLSIAWLVTNVRRRRPIALPAISAGFCFVSAYLYLLVVGRNVPTWVYAALALLVVASAWSTVRSVQGRMRQATDDLTEYDLVVIGGGAAGLTAAGLGSQLAAKTLLVERDKLGGDCTWNGCVPSKALLKGAAVAHLARTAAKFGLEPAELGVDLERVLARVHEVQEGIYEEADRPEIYRNLGAEVRHAAARFIGPNELELTAEGAPPERIRFRYAVIATGSRPRVPAIPGLDSAPYLTNETIFQLPTLPRHLAVLGGGPIGIEMAQAFRRLGSSVTVLQRNVNILPRDEPELTAVYASAWKRKAW